MSLPWPSQSPAPPGITVTTVVARWVGGSTVLLESEALEGELTILVPYTVGGGLDDELAIVELERSNTENSLVTILLVEELVFAETTVVLTWARPWAHVHVAFVAH